MSFPEIGRSYQWWLTTRKTRILIKYLVEFSRMRQKGLNWKQAMFRLPVVYECTCILCGLTERTTSRQFWKIFSFFWVWFDPISFHFWILSRFQSLSDARIFKFGFVILNPSAIAYPIFPLNGFQNLWKGDGNKIILGILGEFWGSLWLNPVPAPINPISYWNSFFGLSENCESFKAVEYFLEPSLWLFIYLNFLASFGSYVIYILVYFKYTIMTERIFWLQLNDRLNYTIL